MKRVPIERISRLPVRDAEGHKGNYGHVLVVGGSRGMIGAAAMAANAAARGGAGLVSFVAPEPVQLTIASLCPVATSWPLKCGDDGQLDRLAVEQMLEWAERCDVLAVGPGMGVGEAQRELVRAAIRQDKPVVLDADGLNNLAQMSDWAAVRSCPLVITPHPGEFSRLTGKSVGDIQGGRELAAAEAAEQWDVRAETDEPLVVVLKGSGTVVTDSRRMFVNVTGNPGMASGGAGDILTGLVAALIGQGLAPFDAAALGVYCHGLAGDYAAEELGEQSIIATDLVDFLPEALDEAVEE